MNKVEIDLNVVVEVMSAQIATMSKENAYNIAVIKSKDTEIRQLQEELNQLRKESIKNMDGDDK